MKHETATEASLAHALKLAEASGTFSERRLSDLHADARQVSKILGKPLEDISLRPAYVRIFLPIVAHATGGAHSKRYKNLRGNLKALAQLIGLHEPRELERHPLTGPWLELYEKIPSGFSRLGLVKAMRFFDWSGLAPETVDDATLDVFEKHLEEHTFNAEIRRLIWRVADSWNRLAGNTPGWPGQRLETRRDKTRHIARPLSGYPESFQQEFEDYFSCLSGSSPFDPQRPSRPLSPRTITTRRQQLRQAGDALVESGRAPETITSLADLVSPEAFQAILRPRYDEKARGWPTSARHFGALLHNVARFLSHKPSSGVSADQLNELAQCLATIKVSFGGVTEKTRKLLRKFDDPSVLGRFFAVPGLLVKEARRLRDSTPVRAAQANETAVLVDLVQFIPLRRRNLAALDMARHFERDGKGRITALVVDGSETKNGRSYSAPLPSHLGQRLEHHLKKYRPQIDGAESSTYLFPSPGGRHRGPESLSRRFSAAVKRHAGIEMRLHDARHLCAWILMREDPRNGPLVQQLLNHASAKTTERFYGDFRQAAAARAYDKLISSYRPDAVLKPTPPGKKKD